MAAMLMLPTYGAMASGVKKEIYEKESAYKMDHWLCNALYNEYNPEQSTPYRGRYNLHVLTVQVSCAGIYLT